MTKELLWSQLGHMIEGDAGDTIVDYVGVHDRIANTAALLLGGRMAAAAHSDAADPKWQRNETANAVALAVELHRAVARKLRE